MLTEKAGDLRRADIPQNTATHTGDASAKDQKQDISRPACGNGYIHTGNAKDRKADGIGKLQPKIVLMPTDKLGGTTNEGQ